MKILLHLVPLLLVACARTTVRSANFASEVRCELLALDASTAEEATASFRASNGTRMPVSYSGYSAGEPLYQREILEGGVWQPSPLGWCGTGLTEHTLDPGQSLDFSTSVPRDGRSYRFSFGDPFVLTPPISAAPR